MWIFYATFAAVCWGMSYAACGPLLKKGLNPLIFLLGYSLCGFLGALVTILLTAKKTQGFSIHQMSREEILWFFFSVGGSALGAFLTYAAMGAKNPTLVSLIEISYPIFVVFFAWIFFKEMELNAYTLCGGLLVIAGVGVIIFGER